MADDNDIRKELTELDKWASHDILNKNDTMHHAACWEGLKVETTDMATCFRRL